MVSFKTFVTEATNLAPSELYKYPERLALFLDKYKNGSPFMDNAGKTVVLKYDKAIAKAIESRNNPSGVILFSADGHTHYRLSDLAKTKEFGGKRSETGAISNGTSYEDAVVAIINQTIATAGGSIDIKLKGDSKVYKGITAAVKVDSKIKAEGGVTKDPKADIILCTDDAKPLGKGSIYISHKKAGGAEAFQQYGGISSAAGEDVANHPLVKAFIRQVVEIIGSAEMLEHPVMGTFSNGDLSNMSIFGPGHGSDYSLQHVQAIGQGEAVLKQSGKFYILDFTHHMSLSSDLSHFKGDYEPVFGATFRTGRTFKLGATVISDVRLGIYPRKLMAGRTGLITVKVK